MDKEFNGLYLKDFPAFLNKILFKKIEYWFNPVGEDCKYSYTIEDQSLERFSDPFMEIEQNFRLWSKKLS